MNKMVNIVKLVQMVDVAISDYTEEDVEFHDVANGEHLRQLQRVRDKYDRTQEEICFVIAELKDSEVDKQRKQDLAHTQTSLTNRMKDNEKKVRKRAAELARTAAQDDVATGAANAEHARKQDRVDKVDVLQRQILRKADDLKHEMMNQKPVKDMKELEVREALIESKDWIKRKNEIETMMDKIEQEAVGLNMDLSIQLTRVGAMKDAVSSKVDALKKEDRE